MKFRVLIFALLLAQAGYSQSKAMQEGMGSFRIKDWSSAVVRLERAVHKKGEFAACEPLGYCYLRLGMTDMAIQMYEIAAASGMQSDSAFLSYSEALIASGAYPRAFDLLGSHAQDEARFPQFKPLFQRCKVACELMVDSARYEIIRVDLPIGGVKMCPQIQRNGLVFAADPTAKPGEPPKFSLYCADRVNHYSFEEPRYVSGFKRGENADGPGCVSSSENQVFFTRRYDKFPDPQNRIARGGVSKILYLEHRGKHWSPATETNLNSWMFSNAHPSLACRDSVIAFASNRPGGRGGADLYIAELVEGGWSLPSNLGEVVNTSGDEYFPTLVGRDTLFFASNGHSGLGGLDLFVTWRSEGKWRTPINLGYPINTHRDDFSISLMPSKGLAYFTSNRGPTGVEDIFAVRYGSKLELVVLDTLSNERVSGCEVVSRDVRGGETVFLTDASGKAVLPLETGLGGYFSLRNPGYIGKRLRVDVEESLPGINATRTISLRRAYAAKVQGTVVDASSGLPLPGVIVEAYLDDEKAKLRAVTGLSGNFEVELPMLGKYFVAFELGGYRSIVNALDLSSVASGTVSDLLVELPHGNFRIIEGRAINYATAEGIEGVNLRIIRNSTQEVVGESVTNHEGSFYLSAEWDSSQVFSIIASGPGYFAQRVDLRPSDEGEKIIVQMRLAEQGLNRVVKTLHFASNRTNLEEITDTDLNEIYYFLLENPTSYVEISSHTDSRGAASFNRRLSERRSAAVKDHIVSRKGIPPERILTHGYGEAMLTNECDDSHPCSEASHGVNRRCEIKVVKYGGAE